MWPLFLLLVVNAAANDRGWMYYIRINLPPLYLNVYMLAMIPALTVAIFTRRGQQLPLQKHPLLKPTLTLFAIALLVGIFRTFTLDSSLIFLHEVGYGVRDFITLPICIFISYRLLYNIDSARKFLLAVVTAGVVVSIAILVFFRTAAEGVSDDTNINAVRTVAYLADTAGIACILLFYTVSTQHRLLPKTLSACLAGLCVLGVLAPLHRSDWVAFAAGFIAMIPLVSRNERWRTVARAAIAFCILAASVYLGIAAASKLTGWDFRQKMEDRILTLLPDAQAEGYQTKAWDTRTPGIAAELAIWAKSPVMGGGFGVQEFEGLTETDMGIHHNAWTDTLAKMGLVGLAPFCLVIFGSMVVGYRLLKQAKNTYLALVGALGFVTGVFYAVLGMATWSFNSQRGAMLLGLTFGALLKCRQLQLAKAQQPIEEAAMDMPQPQLV
jgi:hypothetical protein